MGDKLKNNGQAHSDHVQADDIQAQAVEWFSMMRSDVQNKKDKINFEAWLDQSPKHVQAYEQITAMWRNFERFSDVPSVRTIRQAALDDLALHKAERLENRRRVGLRAMLSAAAVFAVVAIGLAINSERFFGAPSYQTAIGEQKTVVLADDSVVKLNTDTDLQVQYSAEKRQVYLNRGQAHFSVKATPSRPFTVFAGNGSVTATGTKFDVRVEHENVTVTLIEGHVTVTPDVKDVKIGEQDHHETPTQLAPGQQVAYGRKSISEVTGAKLPEITAWQEGELIFDDILLAEAVKEVNRYSAQKVIIADWALGEIRISGMFRTGQSEKFVKALESYFPIEAVQDKKGNRILHAASVSENQ